MTTAAPAKPKAKLPSHPHMAPLGCDPELFISNGKHVVGSERAIPEKGITANYAKVIRDGVQVEFNPQPQTCKAFIGSAISLQFRELKKVLDKTEFKIDMQQVVRLPVEELDALSAEAKRLGCAPSLHKYGDKVDMTLTPANFNMRSAGGHIHISTRCKPDDLVPILDLFVGNTCVLIDRDPMQLERRTLYGRAGEYRTPTHGVEYRVLSNFWLRSYQLMTLVMGLARAANSVVYWGKGVHTSDSHGKRTQQPLMVEALKFLNDGIKPDRLQAAINQNDFDLAMENYELFREFIKEFVPSPANTTAKEESVWPLWPRALRWWRYFVKKGIDHWFKEDPMTHWCNLPDGHGRGWEAFLVGTVRTEYEKEVEARKEKAEE